MAIPGWAHYREATVPGTSCGTCDYFSHGRCEMFQNAPVEKGMVCDRWEGMVEKQTAPLYTAPAPKNPIDAQEARALVDLLGALEPVGKGGGGILYLISHAKTRYNKPGQPHDIVQGWRDIPLDETGRKQARSLGKYLKGQDIETIYSSSLKRASQTADIAGRVAGVKTVNDDSYRPWNLGDFAGHSSAHVLPKLTPYMDDPDKKVEGGESFNDYKKRFVPALEKLLDLVDKGHKIALVTHSRNVEFVEGWLGGHGYRTEVDTKAIENDKVQPASVFQIEMDGGKLAVGKKLVEKGEARPGEMNLRVNGVSRTPSGDLVYRMVTKDGHYVGRTNPTKVRARKGECLTIKANDFGRDDSGDFRWINPNVVSRYTDAPHSWRELEAIAGGSLEKDGPAGPAGDPPPAGDTGGGASKMPDAGALAATGPTLGTVHVNRPLRNISVGYMDKKIKLQIQKADKTKQLIYGVVLEPNSLDTQDDFMLPGQIEKTAHTYLKKVARGNASVSKLQHRAQGFFKTKPGVVPVESFIAPVDFTYDGQESVKKGTWVMVFHVEDPEVWQDVLDGKYTGFSIGGTGIRREVTVPPTDEGYEPDSRFDSFFKEAERRDALLTRTIERLLKRDSSPPPAVAPQPIHLSIAEGAIQVHPSDVVIAEGAVRVDNHVHVPEAKPRGPVRIEKRPDGTTRLIPEDE